MIISALTADNAALSAFEHAPATVVQPILWQAENDRIVVRSSFGLSRLQFAAKQQHPFESLAWAAPTSLGCSVRNVILPACRREHIPSTGTSTRSTSTEPALGRVANLAWADRLKPTGPTTKSSSSDTLKLQPPCQEVICGKCYLKIPRRLFRVIGETVISSPMFQSTGSGFRFALSIWV